jgi:hypothetical protein
MVVFRLVAETAVILGLVEMLKAVGQLLMLLQLPALLTRVVKAAELLKLAVVKTLLLQVVIAVVKR